MSIKSKVIAAAATVTLIGGVGAAGALTATTATAATPSCGAGCVDLFSKQFGTFFHPAFVLDVFRGGAKVGQPLILFQGTNSDKAEDFNASLQGKVSDFFAAGLVSASVELHYGGGISLLKPAGNPAFPDDPAFELEYAPDGVATGLCAGLFATAVQGEKVTLQPCGMTAKTVWILDIPLTALQQSDGCPLNPLYFLEAPLINGSDVNFSHPFVLTYPSNGFPTDRPRPELEVDNLTGFTQTGGPLTCGTDSIPGPASNQEWAAVTGPITH